MERRKAITAAAIIAGSLLVGAVVASANAGLLTRAGNDKVGQLKPIPIDATSASVQDAGSPPPSTDPTSGAGGAPTVDDNKLAAHDGAADGRLSSTPADHESESDASDDHVSTATPPASAPTTTQPTGDDDRSSSNSESDSSADD